MARCDELFDRLREGEIGAIQTLIEEREFEQFFLDFKRSSCDGRDAHLSAIDRKNLAKAISGFGNSDGGVIIWGIDCSGGADGADVAQFEVAIENPRRFAAQLEGAVSGLTIPPHSSVENLVIERDDATGFVVTLIPRSNRAPHRTVNSPQYYIRAGSNFVPAPHEVLAGLFGRRPQPHVFHHYLGSPAEWLDGRVMASIGLMITNDGPGVADDLFAVVTVTSWGGAGCSLQVQPGNQQFWYGNQEFGCRWSLMSRPGIKLPPGASLQPLTIEWIIAPPITQPLHIVGKVGSGASEPYEFELATNVERLTNVYEQYASAPNHHLSVDQREDITSSAFSIGGE